MYAAHRNLISSARWHGRRVGEAIAREDFATARYEHSQWRYVQSFYSAIERGDTDHAYDVARRNAILAGCLREEG